MGSLQVKEAAEPRALSLTNEGRLDITFIGSGSAFSKKFYQNNILIVKGGEHLLVDCGTRAPEALTKLGLSVAAVRNYLITHLHADHIGGLEEVMLVNRYGVKRKTAMVVTPELRDLLWSMSLRGGTSFNESHEGKPLEFSDFWDLVETAPIPGGDRDLHRARVGGLEIDLFRTKHIPDNAPDWRSSFPSYGLVIDGRVLFTSDTRYDPAMIEELGARYKLETIFHDCQLFKGGVHASLDELAGLPAALRAKTMLMHYGDAIDDHRERIAELGFKGVVEQWKTYGFPQPKPRAQAKPRAKRS